MHEAKSRTRLDERYAADKHSHEPERNIGVLQVVIFDRAVKWEDHLSDGLNSGRR